MIKAGLRVSGLAVAGTILVAGAANAQQVISRTSGYTVTWSDSAFAGASALYAASYAYGATAFGPTNFNISVVANAQNFAYLQGGGGRSVRRRPLRPIPLR